jgi:hypothetical protein
MMKRLILFHAKTTLLLARLLAIPLAILLVRVKQNSDLSSTLNGDWDRTPAGENAFVGSYEPYVDDY